MGGLQAAGRARLRSAGGLHAEDFAGLRGSVGAWVWHSLRFSCITAALAVAMAFVLAFAVPRQPDAVTRGVVQLVSVGYAVPGAVIVVGLLLPVGWLQAVAPQWGLGT